VGYLSSSYKQEEVGRIEQEPKISASVRVEHELGEEYVDRFREEVLAEEKVEWINGLAEIYRGQGYKILDKFPFTNEIKQKISEVTGLHSSTVDGYLFNEFKHEQKRPPESYQPQIPASQRVETRLGSEVKERFEEEVKQKLEAEAKLSPEEKQKLEAEYSA